MRGMLRRHLTSRFTPPGFDSGTAWLMEAAVYRLPLPGNLCLKRVLKALFNTISYS